MRAVHVFVGLLVLAIAFLAFAVGYFFSEKNNQIEPVLNSEAATTVEYSDFDNVLDATEGNDAVLGTAPNQDQDVVDLADLENNEAVSLVEVVENQEEQATNTEMLVEEVEPVELVPEEVDEPEILIEEEPAEEVATNIPATVVGTWRLEAVMTDDGATTQPQDYVMYVRPGLNFGGEGACNSYFGQFQGEAPLLAVGSFGATEIACSDNFEQEYFALLRDVRAVRLVPGGFDLLSGERTVLRFRK